ncbi:MAG: hypothetical protein V1728_06700 [Candidatus Micrarchaeota archaeon]
MFLFDVGMIMRNRPPKEEALPEMPYDNVRLTEIGKITKNEQPVLEAGMGWDSIFNFRNVNYAMLGLWASFRIKKVFIPPGMSENNVPPYAERFRKEFGGLLEDVLFNNGEYSKQLNLELSASMKRIPGEPELETRKRYDAFLDDFRTRVEAVLVLADNELVDMAGDLLGPDALGEKFVAATKKSQPKKVAFLFGNEPSVRAAVRYGQKLEDGFFGSRMEGAVNKVLASMGAEEINLNANALKSSQAHMLEKTRAFENRALGELYWSTARSQLAKDFKAFYGLKVMPQQYTQVIDTALLKAGFWDHVNEGDKPANIEQSQIERIKNGDAGAGIKPGEWKKVLTDASEIDRVAESARGFMERTMLKIKKKLGSNFIESANGLSMPELIIREGLKETRGYLFSSKADAFQKQLNERQIRQPNGTLVTLTSDEETAIKKLKKRETIELKRDDISYIVERNGRKLKMYVGGTGFESDFWKKQLDGKFIDKSQYQKLLKGGDYKGILSFEQMGNIANREASYWERVRPRYSFEGKFDRALLVVFGLYMAWEYGSSIIGGILSPKEKEEVNKSFSANDKTFQDVFDRWARLSGNEKFKQPEFAKRLVEWSEANGKMDAQGGERYDALKEFLTREAFDTWHRLDANKDRKETDFSANFRNWAEIKGLNWDFRGRRYMDNIVLFVNEQVRNQKR